MSAERETVEAGGGGEADAQPELMRVILAEAGGAGLLTYCVIASGALGEKLAMHWTALAVLFTALAGAAAFFVLARALAGIAPCLFNPAIALLAALRGQVTPVTALSCGTAQIAAAFIGVMLAHLTLNAGLVQVASQIQSGPGIWAGEAMATILFALAILGTGIRAYAVTSTAVAGAFALLAGALMTPSTSFANPAITLARALTESFMAIRLSDAVTIAALQLAGAAAAWAALRWLRQKA